MPFGDLINTTLRFVDSGDIHVTGKIDDHSLVVLVSTGGSIIIDGKIDGHSDVTLQAAGNVSLGTMGGGDGKIDGNSTVQVQANGNISLNSQINQSSVFFNAHGKITIADKIDQSISYQIADGDIWVQGKIDGTSRVDLISNRGAVKIDGKIDGESKVFLNAASDITMGANINLGDEDRKIDGNSSVSAISGSTIRLQSRISKDHTSADFSAAGGIMITEKISNGTNVRLLSGNGQIHVVGGIADSGTAVIAWPKGALVTNIDPNSSFTESEWTNTNTLPFRPPQSGSWWENWSQTFGYVASLRKVPRSVDDISAAVAAAGSAPVKAVGGGWSFTDASLPLKTQADVDHVSIRLRGAAQRRDMRHVLEGINDLFAMPVDFEPDAVARNLAFSTSYDQATMRQVTKSGIQLAAPGRTELIDTRSLAAASSASLRVSGAATLPGRRLKRLCFTSKPG